MRKVGSIDEMHATWQLLRRTTHAMDRARQKELEEFNISTDAVAVLSTIVQLKAQAIPAEIARHLLLEPNSVSQLLTRLQRAGLVRRLRDLEVKNRVRVELTKEGRGLFAKSQRRRSIRKMMSGLTPEERSQLWETLAKLRHAALRQLRIKTTCLYPPANRSEFFENEPNRYSRVRVQPFKSDPVRV